MSRAKGFIYPIGMRVRLNSGGPDMLVVDLDRERDSVIAAWRNGDAVSEREFSCATLTPTQAA